jgi:glyoxylase-like metal-dependent hydrolase (beta-lactamase superfamily II)
MWQEIFPDLYTIEIPFPKSPLRAVNCYLIKAAGRFLLIDVGINRERCRQEMRSALKSLGVDLDKTDFFITHMHADHLGLVGELATDKSKVYLSAADTSIVRLEKTGQLWRDYRALYLKNGFSEGEADEAISSHPGHGFAAGLNLDFCHLKEGDKIEIGDYCLRVVATPGHTEGHLCLYEPERKILFSGDHILSKITPNIASVLSGSCIPPDVSDDTAMKMSKWNALGHYMASLEKVSELETTLVLPGHRSVCHDLKKRVAELQEHHQARLAEVMSALRDGPKTAYEVAPYVTWDIVYSSWELFPALQKWFAVGETIAHLWYLEANEMIRKETKGKKDVFSLA